MLGSKWTRAVSRAGELAIVVVFIFLGIAPREAISAGQAPKQQAPKQDYLVYFVCEPADKIALIRFGPKGAKVDQLIETGSMPSDIDGPHGIVVSPDKQFYYVSLGHGRPFGSVWMYSTKDNSVLGTVTLGYFPATMDIVAAPDLENKD